MSGKFTLNNFYTSREWCKLMSVLKSERVNEQGQLICEHCGNPIIKSYDCIGHHKIHLTEENVNDAMIALNPDNIALVHHRCHNIIHNRLGIGCKEIYLVYGSPLSGKNTFVKENMNDGDLVIDIDNIWQCISNCDRYVKPNRLRSNVFQIRDTLLDMVRTHNGNWLNAWIVGSYPLSSERERLCKRLNAREIFIDTPKDECERRLLENPNGRDINEWKKFIDDWWDRHTPSRLP